MPSPKPSILSQSAAGNSVAASYVAPSRSGRRFGLPRFGGKFLLLSVLVHVVFLVIAACLFVQTYRVRHKIDFQSGPKGPSAPTRALEHKVQMKRQQTMNAPPQARRVTTTGLAKIALPDLPAAPPMSASLNLAAMSGMGAAGLGPGALGGGAGGMGGNGRGAPINFFGARTGGYGLAGTFYDLKQTPGRTPTNMDPGLYGKIMLDFLKGGWNTGVLNRFYKAANPVYATQIWIPNIPADLGPAAFGLEKIVKPSMWCVHYRGAVVAPETFTFHFVGAGDDLMVVKFNGKLVLDRCWYISTGWKPLANYDYGFSAIHNGFAKGDAIHVEAGQTYPIEVLIGEQPGGEDYAALLQEIDGVAYQKDARGNPILPVFRLVSAKPASNRPGHTFPPHRDDGPVWKAVADRTAKAFSVFDR